MKTVSIIVPVYNEEGTVGEILSRLGDQKILNYQKEIIVVNDGSTDETEKRIKSTSEKIIYILHKKNQGKGQAIRDGIIRASGDYILFQDGDLEYNPKDIPLLFAAMEGSENCVVYGSRNIMPVHTGYAFYKWGGKFLTEILNFFYKSRLSDICTGYKLFPTSVLKSLTLKSTGFEIDAEITAQLFKKNFKITEVAIDYFPRSFAAGKKLRMWDGVKIFFVIIRGLFSKNK
ncbi:MAG: glycosyltransferase family 2 protein [Candidatus Pacebacteria bacterium]|nr:glycosyltransferase family 2 protein [Candidatus Paceibacterota bacterium]